VTQPEYVIEIKRQFDDCLLSTPDGFEWMLKIKVLRHLVEDAVRDYGSSAISLSISVIVSGLSPGTQYAWEMAGGIEEIYNVAKGIENNIQELEDDSTATHRKLLIEDQRINGLDVRIGQVENKS
jgi:hypothetical protein